MTFFFNLYTSTESAAVYIILSQTAPHVHVCRHKDLTKTFWSSYYIYYKIRFYGAQLIQQIIKWDDKISNPISLNQMMLYIYILKPVILLLYCFWWSIWPIVLCSELHCLLIWYLITWMGNLFLQLYRQVLNQQLFKKIWSQMAPHVQSQ